VAGLPPTFAQWFTPVPGDHPDHIHGGGIEELLEVRACEPKVSTPAEIKAPRALREATLDPRPQGILGFKRRRLLALPRGLERLMVGLRADRQLAGSRLCGGTGPAGGTRATGGPVKPDANDRIPRHIASRPPVDTGMALGTVRLLGLPIQHEGLQVIAFPFPPLPAVGQGGPITSI
jgi:hypothetical protein